MTPATSRPAPALAPSEHGPAALHASGDWTLTHANALLALIARAPSGAKAIDGGRITGLDSTGAMLLARLADRLALGTAVITVQPEYRTLLDSVRRICQTPPRKTTKDMGFRAMLERLGYAVEDYAKETLALVGFGGLSLQTGLRTLLHPARVRLTATVHHMEQVGLDAVPLVALLSFMVGSVLAFLGATVLRDFGAEIFVVELVGIASLREFGVLLTAILLAGRTASAFTAQIGMMVNREEVDAIRVLGLDPVDLLVIPRVLALLAMLPLLTFIAMLAGMLGGMAVGAFNLDIPVVAYLARAHETMQLRHFVVGMTKAPLFALVIGLIGCLEGLQVKGTAQSLGERTTSSVVQAISMVIVIDAFAALWFMQMDY